MLESKQRQIADVEKLPIPTVQAIVDGKLTDALSAKTLPVVSPIDGKTITAIPDGRYRSRGWRRTAGLRNAPLAGHEPEAAKAHSARLGGSRRQ
jgi:hypothetical protein